MYWQVEDTLKQKYIQFVEALSTATKDPLEHLKNKVRGWSGSGRAFSSCDFPRWKNKLGIRDLIIPIA